MGIATTHLEVLMKKLFPAVATRSFISTQTDRTKIHVFGVLILLASCTNTQVRWDAVKLRQDVMVYYNDQIVENLIKAKYDLPFVHVDIQNFTSSGASQISGNVELLATQPALARLPEHAVARAQHLVVVARDREVARLEIEHAAIQESPAVS